MKEDGPKINVMGKVPIGLLTPKISLEGSTLVTGKMTQNKEEEPCFTKLEIDMTVCGWITCPMVREE